MGGDIGEIQLGSERELYKYINHLSVVTKASCKIILVRVQYIGEKRSELIKTEREKKKSPNLLARCKQ